MKKLFFGLCLSTLSVLFVTLVVLTAKGQFQTGKIFSLRSLFPNLKNVIYDIQFTWSKDGYHDLINHIKNNFHWSPPTVKSFSDVVKVLVYINQFIGKLFITPVVAVWDLLKLLVGFVIDIIFICSDFFEAFKLSWVDPVTYPIVSPVSIG